MRLEFVKNLQATQTNWVGLVQDQGGNAMVLKLMDAQEVDQLDPAQQTDWTTRVSPLAACSTAAEAACALLWCLHLCVLESCNGT